MLLELEISLHFTAAETFPVLKSLTCGSNNALSSGHGSVIAAPGQLSCLFIIN